MPLGGVLFITIFIGCFGFILLGLAKLCGTKVLHKDPVKLAPYECGIPGLEKKDTKVSIKFYLTAILFILFDIEIIFMYPWATTFRDFVEDGSGLTVLLTMLFFVAVFVYGLFWEIKSKALEWD